MLKELVKVASKLDALGLTREADVVDALIQKIAGYTDFGGGFDEGQGEDSGGFPSDIKMDKLIEKAKMYVALMNELKYSNMEDVGEQRGIYMNSFYQAAEDLGFTTEIADQVYEGEEDRVEKIEKRRRFISRD